MTTGQFERKIVFETFAESIHTIVAIETSIAIRKRMRKGEGNVHLAVAGLAGVGSERRDVAVMTVVAGERCIRSRALMSG